MWDDLMVIARLVVLLSGFLRRSMAGFGCSRFFLVMMWFCSEKWSSLVVFAELLYLYLLVCDGNYLSSEVVFFKEQNLIIQRTKLECLYIIYFTS